jgi:signal peptidase II
VFFYTSVFLVVVLDQLSKGIILHTLALHDSIPVLPGIFHLTLVHNTGIAFGFFKEHSGLLLYLISGSLVLLLLWGVRLRRAHWLACLGLALILGGAIGNWIDRMRFGAVIDFLDFRVWPVFNLADSAISIGVGLYLILVFFKKSEMEHSA